MKWKKEDNRKRRKKKEFLHLRRGDKSSGKAFKTSHRTFMMMTTVERWWWWCWRREEVKLEESRKERTIIVNVTFCPFLHFFFSVSSFFDYFSSLLLFSFTFPRHNQNNNDFFLTDANCTPDLECQKSKENRMWFAVYKGERKSLQVETQIGIHGVQWIKY